MRSHTRLHVFNLCVFRLSRSSVWLAVWILVPGFSGPMRGPERRFPLDCQDYIIDIFLIPFFPRMITSKRRTLTTDDLLRRQEEPQKRHKRAYFAQGDEDEDDDVGEDDDFDSESAPEGQGVEWDGVEWEAGVEESTDSEIGRERPLMEDDPIGRLDESSSLLGSRVIVKPRLVHQRPLSSGARKPVTFSSLGISPPLLSALSKMVVLAPTEIQQACIPPLLAGQFF